VSHSGVLVYSEQLALDIHSPMKVVQRTSSNEKLRQEPLWRLLASPQAPIVLALLQTHLFDKERRLSSSVLHDRLGRDLDLLRDQGWELPQTVQAYISQWFAAGFLERTFQQDVSERSWRPPAWQRHYVINWAGWMVARPSMPLWCWMKHLARPIMSLPNWR